MLGLQGAGQGGMPSAPMLMEVFMVGDRDGRPRLRLAAHDAVWWLRIGRVVKRGLVGVGGGVMVESPGALESAIFGGGEDP